MGNDIRCDRVLSFNAGNLFESAEIKERVLFKKVLYYLMYMYQKNLLNEGIFDVGEFCELCGVNPKFVQQRASSPYQLELENGSGSRAQKMLLDGNDEYLFDNVLDNILFILANKPLRIYRDNEKSVETALIIDRVRFLRRNRRSFYYVHFSDGFCDRLGSYFQICNFDSVMYMCKHDCDDLYFYLLNKRRYFQSQNRKESCEEDNITFDELCRVASISEDIPIKKRKYSLNRVFETLSEGCDFKFELGWKKSSGSCFLYDPVLKFPDISQYVDVYRIKEKDALKNVIKENLMRSFARLFRYRRGLQYDEVFNPEDFWTWMYNVDEDVKEKTLVVHDVYVLKIDGRLPLNIEFIVKDFFWQLDRRVEWKDVTLLKAEYKNAEK